MNPIPNLLTIAGSDPSGGAGLQADLKTFSALGAFGLSVATSLTAQNTLGVAGVHPVPDDFVRLQLVTLLDDIRIDAVKIGMLGTARAVRAVGALLPRMGEVPIVLDPVMVATSGHRLLDEDAVRALREILPLVSMITPNVAEAGALLAAPQATTVIEMEEQAHRLVESGCRRVLVKGGDLDGDRSVDVLVGPEGTRRFDGPRIATANTHGTGCSLSSAIAANRAAGSTWPDAVAAAKSWLSEALRTSDRLDVGAGHGPVNHFHALWQEASS